MSLEHFVRCDALLPNGMRCEKRAPGSSMALPPGWSTICTYRKPTVEDSSFLKSMAAMRPMIDKLGDKHPETVEAIEEATNQMAANTLEDQVSAMDTAHVCPDHPLPKVEPSAKGPYQPLGCY